ncbi:MAG: endolytic transglycosylase MltG, partial [Patescibacteria group bacterium]
MDFLKRRSWWLSSFAVAAVLVGGYISAFAPPSDFPSDSIVVIVRGTSASEISAQLADANAIKYSAILNLILRISGVGGSVKSGAYLFKSPENVFKVSNRLATGAYGLPPVRITFPEGVTVRDISGKVSEAFPLILADDVVSLGKTQEGYLFPDTYFFP